MIKNLKWKKLIPFASVIVLAYMFVGTSVFSVGLQNEMLETGKAFLKGLVPLAPNIFVGLIVLTLAYGLFDPFKEGVSKLLALSKHADERSRRIVSRAAVLSYWGIALVVAATFIAPDLLAKLLVGFGAVGVALGLAMQGAASDWIGGILLNFRPRFRLGDEIQVQGLDGVKGKVIDIGLRETVLELPDGIYFVPNREALGRSIKVMKGDGAAKVVVTVDGVKIAAGDRRDDHTAILGTALAQEPVHTGDGSALDGKPRC